MRKRFLERAWTAALALIASIAIAMALYLQVVERKTRQEADHAADTRLEAELAEARARVDSLEKQSAEPTPEQPVDQPLPDTVLRRGESGGSALQKTLDSRDAQLARLQESLNGLERRSEQSDRALRRDLEELRTEARREQEASGRVQSLLLVALIPLLLHLVTSFWPRGDRQSDKDS